MRNVLGSSFVFAFVVGCNGGGLPITGNGAQSGQDGGAGIHDMTTGHGGAVDLAQGQPPGGMCNTACDCESGLACLQGQCMASNFGKLYCCESSDCPQGNICQSAMGNFSQCGGGGGGGGGGGSSCMTACDCTPGLACLQGSCVMSMFGAVYCCDNGMCPQGSFCQSSQGGFMQCGGGGGGAVDFGTPQCNTVRCRPNNDFCPMIGCGTCDPTSRRCSG